MLKWQTEHLAERYTYHIIDVTLKFLNSKLTRFTNVEENIRNKETVIDVRNDKDLNTGKEERESKVDRYK